MADLRTAITKTMQQRKARQPSHWSLDIYLRLGITPAVLAKAMQEQGHQVSTEQVSAWYSGERPIPKHRVATVLEMGFGFAEGVKATVGELVLTRPGIEKTEQFRTARTRIASALRDWEAHVEQMARDAEAELN